MPKLEILQFACLTDNYGVLIHDAEAGLTASIDAPDAGEILDRLRAKGWRLTHLLITHHHGDHTGGNLQLKQATGCTIIGPAAEAERIPGIDETVAEGDTIAFGDFPVRVLETPGHTIGHVSYWIPEAHVAFTGDTLFSMGAGRVFEGNAEMMWSSLQEAHAAAARHRDLLRPRVHGHQRALRPDRRSRQPRLAERVPRRSISCAPRAGRRCRRGSTASWRRTRFCARRSPAIRAKLGMPFAPDWKVFAEIRERKNKA